MTETNFSRVRFRGRRARELSRVIDIAGMMCAISRDRDTAPPRSDSFDRSRATAAAANRRFQFRDVDGTNRARISYI